MVICCLWVAAIPALGFLLSLMALSPKARALKYWTVLGFLGQPFPTIFFFGKMDLGLQAAGIVLLISTGLVLLGYVVLAAMLIDDRY